MPVVKVLGMAHHKAASLSIGRSASISGRLVWKNAHKRQGLVAPIRRGTPACKPRHIKAEGRRTSWRVPVRNPMRWKRLLSYL